MAPSSSQPIRVLIYGKDARSDALAASCAASSARHELYAYTQFLNPGFSSKCKDVGLGLLTDLDSMVEYARRVQPHLVIVGPEDPLAVGLVDALEAMGIPCFGPSRGLARLETSKSWTRRLLDKHRIPGNPEYRIFSGTYGLEDYLKGLGEFVVKPDGLTGGKGVRVSGEHIFSIDEATRYAEELLQTASCFVVEERLDGEEFSLQSICDGEHLFHCPAVQDHKRAFESDTGPNTGGMGSYSCPDHSLPFLSKDDIAQARAISVSVAHALLEESGMPYKGVLYGGFMATRKGVKLIEYNARFGDPEAMNILPILDGDFLAMCEAVTQGDLDKVSAGFRPLATVCKYVVPAGYPTDPAAGERIVIPRELFSRDDLQVYFAAVHEEEGEITLTGSRSLAFVGIGETIAQAEALAEYGASSVQGPLFHRKDIGTAGLVEARIRHMRALRDA